MKLLATRRLWPGLVLAACLLTLPACTGTGVRPDASSADATTTEADTHAAHERAFGLAPEDPWEGFNRHMYAFNDAFDRIIFRPVAKGYATITPRLVRLGISNFFSNLQQPITALNLVLTGHPGQAGVAMGRFLMNLTLGIGGIFDPATDADIPKRNRDFGQTLAQWGWKDSRYLVLPVFGPSTLRDGLGKGASTSVSPVTWLARREGAEVSILYGVDARASVLPFEAMMQDAADPYLMIRDAYLQRRRCQIVDCSEELPDYLLPDYDFEIPDFDSLRY